ncbi:MAG: hypothetical protein AVDCRST_MAG64-234 [uncultured Phycisphaerae bacterium]|uniref:Uncharacterized protein n=1 Tax=uncultured Phycisphaerae bacterium TaxID=904963 RepID=A0A6J4N533_9BACT|nr:MAG: hypothetical protein AVDCRST_MAG64-234 [uncultured Phycisphaerae bacterium]
MAIGTSAAGTKKAHPQQWVGFQISDPRSQIRDLRFQI